MEIEAEIEDEVKAQLAELTRLDESWTGEALYTDGDLTRQTRFAVLRVQSSRHSKPIMDSLAEDLGGLPPAAPGEQSPSIAGPSSPLIRL